ACTAFASEGSVLAPGERFDRSFTRERREHLARSGNLFGTDRFLELPLEREVKPSRFAERRATARRERQPAHAFVVGIVLPLHVAAVHHLSGDLERALRTDAESLRDLDEAQ